MAARELDQTPTITTLDVIAQLSDNTRTRDHKAAPDMFRPFVFEFCFFFLNKKFPPKVPEWAKEIKSFHTKDATR